MIIKCKRVDFLGVIQSINLSSSDNETSTSSSTADTFNMLQTPSQPKRSRPTNFISPGLAAALDRTKVSDRNAAYIIAATAESLGHSSSALAINKETIRKSRPNHRERAAKEIRASFDPSCPLTVHCYGKMLPACFSIKETSRPSCRSGIRRWNNEVVGGTTIAKWNWTGRSNCRPI